jgi:hypothetical protein
VVEHDVSQLRDGCVSITLYLAPFDGRLYLGTSPFQDILHVTFQLVCKQGVRMVCQLCFILVNIAVGQEVSFPGV